MTKRGWKDALLELLYPPRCIFCDEVVHAGNLCDPCAASTEGLRLKGSARIVIGQRTQSNTHMNKIIASFVYTGLVAEVVARYKFNGRPDLYRQMAEYMAADTAEMIAPFCHIDLVMDVPSFQDKSDHARILAKGVANQLDKPYAGKVLTKVRKTLKQHEQIYRLRKDNIRDAFGVRDSKKVEGKIVLVCDDVITSGHTLNACAAALKRAGAAEVYGCVFSAARTRS